MRTRTPSNLRAPGPSAFPAEAPTSEEGWQAFVAALAPLGALAPTGSVVVISPHPDDETLGCGGLMADLAARGAKVRVVAVTDGEGSHPTLSGLADLRIAEQRRALDALGVAADPVRLRLPDGRVHEYEDRLHDLLVSAGADAEVIVAPWSGDGHTDHDACGRAARRAGRRSGRRVLAYPVWAWQWARPSDLDPLPWLRWDLDVEARRRKAAAIERFETQLTDRLGPPVVDATALVRFRRPSEVFADVG